MISRIDARPRLSYHNATFILPKMSSPSSPIDNTSPSPSFTNLPDKTPNPTASSSPTLNASDGQNGCPPTLEEDEDIEKQQGEKRTKGSDAQLHTWDGPQDPEHPTNWPLGKKLCTTAMLAAVTVSISLNSAMFEPATQQVVKEFKGVPKVTLLGTSLYLLVLPPELFRLLHVFLLANCRAGLRPRSSLLGSHV